MIQSAIELQDEGVIKGYYVTMDNGKTLSVPNAAGNRHYQELMEWVAEGNTISPYVPPPPPTPEQLLAQTDAGMIRVVEDLTNLLVEKGVITIAELPTAAQEKLAERQALRAQLP